MVATGFQSMYLATDFIEIKVEDDFLLKRRGSVIAFLVLTGHLGMLLADKLFFTQLIKDESTGKLKYLCEGVFLIIYCFIW